MQIVLAKLEDDQELVKLGRVDIGERHTFRDIKRSVSVMWLNDGDESDWKKAVAYAATEGYAVFTYNGESDPLARARKEIADRAK